MSALVVNLTLILSQIAEGKLMKLVAFRKFFMVVGLAFLVVIGASYEARAQGRGWKASKWDKKCDKFVNCHDASEGRLDGRGPRRGTDSDAWGLETLPSKSGL